MATSMPTAAKAAGAFFFAIVGWLIADAYIPSMTDATGAGHMREYNALVGAIIGWAVMGNSVGHKYIDSVGYGWKTVIVLVIVALFTFGLHEMLKQSTRMVYDDPIEAISDIFYQMFKRSKTAMTLPVFTTMFFGGAVAGFCTEYVSRRWR
jgi:hypothetical protein